MSIREKTPRQIKGTLDPLGDPLAGPFPIDWLPLFVGLDFEEVYSTVPLDGLGPIQHRGMCVFDLRLRMSYC
jgi:hypothetical protein